MSMAAASEKPVHIKVSRILSTEIGSADHVIITEKAHDLPKPSQLPPPPRTFVSRTEELSRLDQWLNESDGTLVVAISGTGGVGKSTLALRWLHGVRHRFPDGMLYADLGAYSSIEPADPEHILEAFLLALGIPASNMPTGLPQRQALFRSLTSGRAHTFLLDDAVSAAQARPLLPAHGNNVVVVTSRRRLSGLSLEGAAFLDLHPMSIKDSVQLLTKIVGADRLDRERNQAEELARLCEGMPIALSVVGARLSARPHRPVSREVGALRSGDRLATLTHDDSSVSAVFDLSYFALKRPSARAYRFCSLHPGRQFGLSAAAAAVGEEPDELEESLGELVDCNLIAEVSDRRYKFHSLLYAHARQQAERSDGPDEREAAVRRMAEWYLDRSAAADFTLRPTRRRVGSRFRTRPESPFPSHRDALRWLAEERHNLLAMVQTADEHGWDDVTWEFCEAMWGFFLHARHYDDWLQIHELGIPAAQRTGNLTAEARLRTQLIVALTHLRRFDDALGEGAVALSLAANANDEFTKAALLFELAGAVEGKGDLQAALRYLRQAEVLRERIGTERAAALCRRRIGEVLAKLGHHDEAVAILLEVAEYMSTTDRAEYARVLTRLGAIYVRTGRQDASTVLAEALGIARELGSPLYEAGVLAVLGDAAQQQGNIAEAQHHWAAAVEIYSRGGDPKAEELSARLSSLPSPRKSDS
ncbi:ATP-binding protein [Kibdelosporangium philippinense]